MWLLKSGLVMGGIRQGNGSREIHMSRRCFKSVSIKAFLDHTRSRNQASVLGVFKSDNTLNWRSTGKAIDPAPGA